MTPPPTAIDAQGLPLAALLAGALEELAPQRTGGGGPRLKTLPQPLGKAASPHGILAPPLPAAAAAAAAAGTAAAAAAAAVAQSPGGGGGVPRPNRVGVREEKLGGALLRAEDVPRVLVVRVREPDVVEAIRVDVEDGAAAAVERALGAESDRE